MITGKERFLGAIAYFSWLFLLVAILVTRSGRTEFVRHHINQGFMLQIIASAVILLTKIQVIEPIVGTLSLMVAVFVIWGVITAILGKESDIPILNMVEFIK